jgi:hypothetical protein
MRGELQTRSRFATPAEAFEGLDNLQSMSDGEQARATHREID